MYDIEFMLIISSKETSDANYKNRFLDFKKYGLLNIKDHKVNLKLLVFKYDNFSQYELLNDWPKGIDVEVINQESEHPACKICDYYLNFSNADNAKWFAKVDDDSITDVDRLMANLELHFEYTKEYYLATEIVKCNTEIEKDILISMGLNHLAEDKFVSHEWEMSILSQEALRRILNTPNSKKVMELRSKIAEGWGDHALAVAARLAKVYPCEAYFLTQWPILKNFSIFGGYLNHIHYVSREKNNKVLKMLIKHSENKICPMEIWEKIKNKKFLFTRQDLIPIFIFEFNISGKLNTFHLNPINETFWFYENGRIYICDKECQPTTILDIINDDYMEGKFLHDPKVTHKVTKLNLQ